MNEYFLLIYEGFKEELDQVQKCNLAHLSYISISLFQSYVFLGTIIN